MCEYDGDRCADLGGTLNVEGAWCREVGATFVHLELDRAVRDDPTEARARRADGGENLGFGARRVLIIKIVEDAK